MAIAEFHFTSRNALNRMHAATVIVPEGQPGPFPVLYLLHGFSDDHTAWTRRSNIEHYVEGLPLIVVMPDTEHGCYVDASANPGGRFETYIVGDLVPFIDGVFNTRAERSGRALAGLSMGGYGSVRLALRHPELFCAAHGLSSGFAMPQRAWERGDAEFQLIFGAKPAADDEYSVFSLAERVAAADPPIALPQITFDCGIDDFVLPSNREFHQRLKGLGLPHAYTEYPGRHDWAYWNEHVLGALASVAGPLHLDLSQFDPRAFIGKPDAPLSQAGYEAAKQGAG